MNVPEIRFKEFCDYYSDVLLEKCLSVSNKKNNKFLKEGQKAERVEKPCSPFTPRTGQLSDIITGSPISLSMEEPVPARPNP